MAAFLNQCEYTCTATLKHYLDNIGKTFLSPFLSRTTVNGLLHRGGMFVLSAAQFRTHLETTFPEGVLPYYRPHLLDIGAGDGGVTARLAPMFTQVFATEFSTVMQWRLRARGYRYDLAP